MAAYYLHELPILMTEKDFDGLLSGFRDDTAPRYYRRAKQLIVRGLLSSGCDAREIDARKEIIAGSLKTGDGKSISRIFIVTGGNHAEVVWEGPSKEFRKNYQRIRDVHCGYV